MNANKLLLIGGALAVLAGCTVQTMVPHTKGKVIVSSERAGTHHTAGKTATPSLSLASKLKSHPAAALASRRIAADRAQHITRGASRSRDLSVWDDVDEMWYTVTNLDPNSGEEPIHDWIDPWWPYLDLYLTPGQTYKITLDVTIWSGSPNKATWDAMGITGFGDQATFTVDDWYDTYVDLYVHPTGAPIFNPASVASAGTTVSGTIPDVGNTSKTLLSSGSGSAPAAGDQFLYGPEPSLYYFSQANQKLYVWSDLEYAASEIYDASTDGSDAGPLTVYAVAIDPYYTGTAWLLAKYDNTGSSSLLDNTDSFGIFYLDTSTANNQALGWINIDYDIGADWSENYYNSTEVHPTGIAVDIDGNTFVTAMAYDASRSSGGVIEYDWYGNPSYLSPYHLEPQDEYYSDVALSGGRAFVATTPIFDASYPSSLAAHNSGKAQILSYDPYWWEVLDSATKSWSAPTNHPAANSLWGPAKFQGFGPDGMPYFTQFAWASTGWASSTPTFSSLASDWHTVTDH